MSYTYVIGIHDLVIHNYGVHNDFVTVHVELDSKMDMIERVFKGKMLPLLVIFFSGIIPQMFLQVVNPAPMGEVFLFFFVILFFLYLSVFVCFAYQYWKIKEKEKL